MHSGLYLCLRGRLGAAEPARLPFALEGEAFGADAAHSTRGHPSETAGATPGPLRMLATYNSFIVSRRDWAESVPLTPGGA